MSLFKTRDWWSTVCGDDDLFDFGCLKVGNLNENRDNSDLIVTGSYNGFLRIYDPSANKGTNRAYRAHDMIIEKSFQYPIIQLEIGRFVSTSNKIHLAILFPRKLSIYEVIGLEGNVDHGNQYSLKFIYEHVLQRTAFNMCKGSFGGFTTNNEPRDYICVQSMDGTLSFYEYESFSLSCFLPNALIPGPLKYIPKTDTFVTVSSFWQVECYKYQVLATNRESFDRKTETQKAKKVPPEWVFNIGEAAVDIEIINQGNNALILILGERNLFCFSDTLTLKYMKKFDYNPSCFVAYPVKEGFNFMIATHSKFLFLHEDVKVKWAAQLDHVPVQMVIAKINDLKGLIVSISENGRLHCSYLGTDPAFSNPIGMPDERSFDYKNAESEYRSLQAKIKEAIMTSGTVMPGPTSTGKSGLSISVEAPKQLDSMSRARDSELNDITTIPSISVKVQIKSAEMLQNVKVSIVCQLPIVAVPDEMHYSMLGGVPMEQDVLFYMKTKHVPSNLNVTIVASYNHQSGTTRVSETKFRLPLKLVMKSLNQQIQQKKTTVYKLIFDTSKSCVNLIDIFPEFSDSYTLSTGNSLAVQYYGGYSVSIQASKSSNRYRLQSESFEALWLITQEFYQRITNHFKSHRDFCVAFQDSLPIDEYKEVIEKHLQIRITADRLREMIEQYSVQFRSIQKRILNKFKDKTPSSLDNLDALLEATYRQLTGLADRHEANQAELSVSSNALSCATNLYVLLISLGQNLAQEEVEVLQSVMTPQLMDTADLGWEETVNAAVTNLLRTSLSKTSKDQFNSQQQLKIPTDILKLEKHIKTMCEKIEKGSTLVPGVTRQPMNITAQDSRSQSSLSQFGSSSTTMFSESSETKSKATPRDIPKPTQPTSRSTLNEVSFEELITPRGGRSSNKAFQSELDDVLKNLDN